MSRRKTTAAAGMMIALVVVGVGWFAVRGQLTDRTPQRPADERPPAPVEVAPVEHGRIEWRRTFSSTLESRGRFLVAPKISGRIERIMADMADVVGRGQVLAELDSAEYEQAVAQSEAELVVARANLTEARHSLEIADREIGRIRTLQERGVASPAQLDTAEANRLARIAAVEVAHAQVTRAEAALASARIRLGYTRITADWTGSDEQRVIAERFVNEGDTVAANDAMFAIVALDPIHAVFHVSEREYAQLGVGQPVTLTTDAHPGMVFDGAIERVAPVFRQASRQARVEVSVANRQHLLKPGMFARAEVILAREDDATIVPLAALTRREDRAGLFIVNEISDAQPELTVSWRPVEVGIRQDQRVQVTGDRIVGRVVTLGQQLVADGSPIVIPEPHRTLTAQDENPSP